MKKQSPIKSNSKQPNIKDFPTLNLITETDIAMNFANKVYEKFDRLIKAVVLFGSVVKGTNTSSSDIDIIIIIDDASVKFDQELVAWYREELGKIISLNPYKKELHINTIKLTTWWHDLLNGDPVVINIIRYGEEILDFAGFYRPLKILLQEGKIRSTPEAIYTALERAPIHLANSKRAEMNALEGVYWAVVDSAHAALMSAKVTPPSPEYIPTMLRQTFVTKKMLDNKYVRWYEEIFSSYKSLVHGKISEVSGTTLDLFQSNAREFISVMAELIRKIS